MIVKKVTHNVKTGETIEEEVIVPGPTAAEIATRNAGIINNNIVSLWQAAHDYEYLRISGSAIGLLTLGAIQGKPKCLAVKAWINSIWTLYYTRKAAITADSVVDLDFTSCGKIPHTIPELIVEVGV